ncbi:hypothetical protein M378DRAFT_18739 [Amanita muscaria Koide BX008]|uniref:Uncharacterized protein n=1 Tax=Amanita muscaria (strain Koide BX008) TaxID=946122 RepID=A0A0C2WET5_AMAMK|nr:hypothetical protein M378DRAFT_18739 [Amanita muscaria Koide BX008]
MAFSLDKILAIGDRIRTIKLYNTNTHSFISTLSFDGFAASLAFSPDCTHLAGGNRSGNVYLWDMRGIDASSPPSTLQIVTAMALSRDCSRLACVFLDGSLRHGISGTVELWETSPIKRRSAFRHDSTVCSVGFAPDGRLFASVDLVGTINLWNAADGSLHGTLKASPGLRAVALSNSVLVAAGLDVTLWSLDTLSPITLKKSDSDATTGSHPKSGNGRGAVVVSISDESDLVAIGFEDKSVHLVDVVNRTTIATFAVPCVIYKLTFLPDKSRLVVQTNKTEGSSTMLWPRNTNEFLSLDLINNCITNGPTLEHLIQLPDITLWHGVPVSLCSANEEHYVAALFSQDQTPVPVLWIPSDISVSTWTQGPSMIALDSKDGRIILLRIPTNHLD